jgi:hypothetical protein
MKPTHLLPFMSNEDLKELAQSIVAGDTEGVPLAMVYPFLDRDDLDRIVEEAATAGRHKDVYSALPFLSKEAVQRLHERVASGELEGLKEEAFLPFLGKDKIKELFNRYVKHTKRTNQTEDEEPNKED